MRRYASLRGATASAERSGASPQGTKQSKDEIASAPKYRGFAMTLGFIFLTVMFSSVLLSTAQAQAKGKPKEAVLTTCDIKDPYKVIGIISARSGEIDLDSLNDKLREQAKSVGADYVVGVSYLTYSGYVYANGTAVKIKE